MTQNQAPHAPNETLLGHFSEWLKVNGQSALASDIALLRYLDALPEHSQIELRQLGSSLAFAHSTRGEAASGTASFTGVSHHVQHVFSSYVMQRRENRERLYDEQPAGVRYEALHEAPREEA